MQATPSLPFHRGPSPSTRTSHVYRFCCLQRFIVLLYVSFYVSSHVLLYASNFALLRPLRSQPRLLLGNSRLAPPSNKKQLEPFFFRGEFLALWMHSIECNDIADASLPWVSRELRPPHSEPFQSDCSACRIEIHLARSIGWLWRHVLRSCHKLQVGFVEGHPEKLTSLSIKKVQVQEVPNLETFRSPSLWETLDDINNSSPDHWQPKKQGKPSTWQLLSHSCPQPGQGNASLKQTFLIPITASDSARDSTFCLDSVKFSLISWICSVALQLHLRNSILSIWLVDTTL